ncbi:quinone-dependent dihydroorotate dehydrogenase [Actinotalea sp. BY-33]|uniref:Dihydroorotate dehydrogenase (quinone) n=1 Tax=Actinotalea soli TaxID=2819234 RepID=A0A939RTX1_9CELL|nr:quinone-dependent dihydroorotate dehydrogenase [Actinotalea soli]MBO1750610.1 quinone-dependent dihydroorotate dehydrogenase [Actinotalea soli]
MYRLLFTHVLRRIDPERADHLGFAAIRAAAVVPGVRHLLARRCAPPTGGEVEVFGRRLPGRFGLAAGFDKDGVGVRGLTTLGFAFVEVGTITAHAQPGNPRPRLWRVLDERAVRNRMGFNNAGAAVAAARLRGLRGTGWGRDVVLGVNIGKTKVTPDAEAASDYATSAALLAPVADYLVVNVSSPNTPGLRALQSVEHLRPILEAVRAAADGATPRHRHVPLLVKIAPDLQDREIDDVADLVTELGLDGVVAVNTTIDHDHGEGGLSGPPLLARGLEVTRRLRDRLGPTPTLIGVGGVTSGRDAQAYLDAGADLVQGYTGLVYEGPFWAAHVHRALVSGATP